jgi:nucleoid-associated protein YgaU
MGEQRFDQPKMKHQSVLNFMPTQNVQLQNVNMEGDKLFIRATAPSADIKYNVWNQIKLVDPNYADLTAQIDAPAAAAAAGGAPVSGVRTYTVQPGDNLSHINKHFYGGAGMELIIP